MDTNRTPSSPPADDPLRWLTSPKTVVAALAVVVIGFAGASCGAQPTPAPKPVAAPAVAPQPIQSAPAAPTAAPAPPPPVLQVGVPFTAGNWETTVLESRRMKEIKSRYSSAVAKGEFVVVGLELNNVGRENFGLNAWDFELYDATGIKYRSASIYVSDWEQALGYEGEVGSDTRQMPPGVPGRYVLAFDVAPGSEGLRLRLVQTGAEIPL